MILADFGAAEIITYGLQLAVGCVFLSAALPKLLDLAGFRRVVSDYAILPSPVVPLVAPLLVISEVVVCISFLTGYVLGIGLLFAVALLGVFGVGIGVNLQRGRRINCGCFGSNSDSISMRSLARLALLLAGVLALVLVRDAGMTLGAFVAGGASSLLRLVEAAALAAFLLVLAAWILAFPELARVFQRTGRLSWQEGELSR